MISARARAGGRSCWLPDAAIFALVGRPVDVFDLALGGERLVVISIPAGEGQTVEGLTRAERAVARGVLSGWSNAEIARRRRSSPRTVANQLASIYRKLGVSSRAELAMRLASMK
jgi:DNA-binding NarL/FixJ family response regulator